MTRMILAMVFFLSLPAPIAQAEMDHSDYEVPPADLTEEDAATLRERIAAEVAAERARAEAEAEVRAEAERLEAERLAARPLGERLVEARCAACHARESYREASLGWIGWQATVWRMDLFNGAGLERGEHGEIADWLHAQYPPTSTRAALEWLALPVVLVALALTLTFRRRRSGTRRKPH